MKTCVISPNGSIAKNMYSHRAAWVYMRQFQEAGTDWVMQPDYGTLHEYDMIIIYLGMEWKGNLNLFGGIEGSKTIQYLVEIEEKKLANKCRYLDLRHEHSYKDPRLSKKEREKLQPSYLATTLEERARKEFPEIRKIKAVMQQPISGNLVVGDSHALSQWQPGYTVYRNDFHTLHGTLQRGLHTMIDEAYPLENLRLCFGNIDIRHHLCRPESCTPEELAEKYVTQIMQLFPKYKDLRSVEIIEPLPIEDESRKIPSSGHYKGTAYYGSWEERNKIRNRFVRAIEHCLETMDTAGVILWKYPSYFYNSEGQLDFEFMERPRSVHVAWRYRRQEL